jgi:hypothetical protein
MLFLQYRPEHAKFRNGPPANLEQQDVMFKKAHVPENQRPFWDKN